MNPNEEVGTRESEAQRSTPPPTQESPKSTDESSRASPETRAVIEEGKEAVQQIGGVLSRPGVGATVTGGLVLGAAVMFGIPEAIVGAGAAYVAYRVLKRRKLRS